MLCIPTLLVTDSATFKPRSVSDYELIYMGRVPRCRSVAARSKGVCLRPVACWDCGFESRRGHGVSCECCELPVTRPEESYRVWCLSVI
jgi:hypothetical protein